MHHGQGNPFGGKYCLFQWNTLLQNLNNPLVRMTGEVSGHGQAAERVGVDQKYLVTLQGKADTDFSVVVVLPTHGITLVYCLD